MNSTVGRRAVRRVMSLLVGGLATATMVVGQSPSAIASPSSDSPSCLRTSPHVQASFALDDEGPRARITSVEVTGLDAAGCNGVPAELRLLGNSTGDPSAPASSLLSTLDSRKNPCTGVSAETPSLVSGGAIKLQTCATDSAAVGSSVDIHDLTLMIVRIRAEQVSLHVLGEHVSRHVESQPSPGHTLPFTGGWIALTVAIGAAAFVLGLTLSLIRRRRSAAVTVC